MWEKLIWVKFIFYISGLEPTEIAIIFRIRSREGL